MFTLHWGLLVIVHAHAIIVYVVVIHGNGRDWDRAGPDDISFFGLSMNMWQSAPTSQPRYVATISTRFPFTRLICKVVRWATIRQSKWHYHLASRSGGIVLCGGRSWAGLELKGGSRRSLKPKHRFALKLAQAYFAPLLWVSTALLPYLSFKSQIFIPL